MNYILIYTLKSAICLAVLYLPFRALLKKETFVGLNRYLLLTIIAISAILPTSEVTIPIKKEPVANEEIRQQSNTVTATADKNIAPINTVDNKIVKEPLAGKEIQTHPVATNTPYNTIETEANDKATSRRLTLFIVSIIYIVGVAVNLFIKITGIIQMQKMIKQGCLWKDRQNGCTIYCHANETAAFSWMNSIVIWEEDYNMYGKEILLHEEGHVKNRHSWDMLFLGIAQTWQWFNPFIYMLQKDIKELHEYEADKYAIEQTNEREKYGTIIIKKAVGKYIFGMANTFNQSTIHKRIDMMNREYSPRWKAAKYLYLVPAIIFSITIFARPIYIYGKNGDNQRFKNEIIPFTPLSVNNSDEKVGFIWGYETDYFSKCDKLPEYPGNIINLYKWGVEEIEKKMGILESLDFDINFTVSKDGNVKDVNIVEYSSRNYPQHLCMNESMMDNFISYYGERLLKEEYAKLFLANSGRWLPAEKNGKKIDAKYSIHIPSYNVITSDYYDTPPVYAGEESNIINLLHENIKKYIPEEKDKAFVTAHLHLVTDTAGRITKKFAITTTQTTLRYARNEELQKEIENAADKIDKWKPAIRNGKKTNGHINIPLYFVNNKTKENREHFRTDYHNFYLKREEYYLDDVYRFPGGNTEFHKWIEKNICYPLDAYNARIDGNIPVCFEIDPKGKVKNVEIFKFTGHRQYEQEDLNIIRAQLEKEALRLVKQMPQWEINTADSKLLEVSCNRFIVHVRFDYKKADRKKIRNVAVEPKDYMRKNIYFASENKDVEFLQCIDGNISQRGNDSNVADEEENHRGFMCKFYVIVDESGKATEISTPCTRFSEEYTGITEKPNKEIKHKIGCRLTDYIKSKKHKIHVINGQAVKSVREIILIGDSRDDFLIDVKI